MLFSSSLSCFAAVDEARDARPGRRRRPVPARRWRQTPPRPHQPWCSPRTPLPARAYASRTHRTRLDERLCVDLGRISSLISSECSRLLSWVRHFSASFNSACVRAYPTPCPRLLADLRVHRRQPRLLRLRPSSARRRWCSPRCPCSLWRVGSRLDGFFYAVVLCRKPAIILSNHHPLFTEAVSISVPPPPPVALDTEAEEASSRCWIMMSACGIVVVVQ